MAPEAVQPQFKLPVQVTGLVDIGRLLRETEKLHDTFQQLELRKSKETAKLPKTSKLLDQTVELNDLNLLHGQHREWLIKSLKTLRQEAPVLHISFSADPSPTFSEKLMAWLRQEIHPLVLVTVGLQPDIGAGCIVRSTNHQFDLSLKQDFIHKRDLLLEQIKALNQQPVPATSAEPAVVQEVAA